MSKKKKNSRSEEAKAAKIAKKAHKLGLAMTPWNFIPFLVDTTSTRSIFLSKFDFALTLTTVWAVLNIFTTVTNAMLLTLIRMTLPVNDKEAPGDFFKNLKGNKLVVTSVMSTSFYLFRLAGKGARMVDPDLLLQEAARVDADDESTRSGLVVMAACVEVLRMRVLRLSFGDVAVLIAGILVNVFVLGID